MSSLWSRTPFQKNSLSGPSRSGGGPVGLESEHPEPLPAEHFTVLVSVSRQPGDEMPRAQRGLLLVGDVLENLRHRDDVAETGIAFDLELGVGRHDAGVTGLFDERRRVLAQLDGNTAAFGDALDLGRGHRPRLQHDRRGHDAAEPRLLREFGVEVDRVHVGERMGPVPDHRLVHRIRRDRRLAGRAGGLADQRIQLFPELGLVVCHFASPF
jgi:hypothetical protein